MDELCLSDYMDFIIRNADINDIYEIQRMNKLLFEKEYNEYDDTLNLEWTFGEEGTKYFTDRITNDDGCSFVAIIEDKVVGYLAGGLLKAESYRKEMKMAELENMLVLEEYRSKGIGKALYEKFVEWCKTNGIERISVVSSAENEKGCNFYRMQGLKDFSITFEKEI